MPTETPAEKVDRYVAGVLSGEIVAGRHLRLAVERYVADRANPRDFVFDEDIADRACSFFPEALIQFSGEWAGQPFELTGNQAFIVWNLWGFRRPDGTRRFRSCYLTAARKWGKSTFAAGLALLCMVADYPREADAYCFCVATKFDQARLIYDAACNLRSVSPAIAEHTEALTSHMRAKPTAPQPHAMFRALGSDRNTLDGLNTHLMILDEIHAWQEHHQGTWDKVTTAGGSRRQPLILIITTAGDDQSEIWKRRHYASCAMLDAFEAGENTADTHFAFIAQIDTGDDCFDEKCWPKANPNFPITPKLDYLRQQAEECQTSPAEKAKFERFHTNRQIASLNRAINMKSWSACSRSSADWSGADFIGGGLDFGGLNDLAAAALCARIGDRFEFRIHVVVSADASQDLRADPWAQWIAAGALSVSDSPITDLEAWILDSRADQVACDPFNAMASFERFTAARGPEFAYKMPQRANQYNEPIRTFQKQLAAGVIAHPANPVLDAAMRDLHVKPDSVGDFRPIKAIRDAKIDPAVALLMAFRCALFGKARPNRSYYATNPVEFI